MTWFITLDNTVAVEDNDAETERDAIEVAALQLITWMQDAENPMIELCWNVEHE